MRLISIRLSTTSRTVCGALEGREVGGVALGGGPVLPPPPAPTALATADTHTTGLHDDPLHTMVGTDVGGTLYGIEQ